MVRMIRRARFFAAAVVSLASAVAQSTDGVWRSEGYGYVLEFHGPSLKAFEVTTQTCVAGFTATREDSSVPGREVTFRTADGEVFFIKTGGTNDHKLLHNDGSASDMRIDRVPGRRAACDQETPNTPIGNLEAFTRTWAENYISFDLKHADWDKVVAENRANVSAETTPAKLFDILEGMIQPFGDAHTFLMGSELKREFHGFRPGTHRVVNELAGGGGMRAFQRSGVSKLFEVTERGYLHSPLRTFCNDQIKYGHIDDTTGYLRITSFSGYAKGGFANGAAALEAALDEIFSDPELKALVIDVRINFGGDDPYGLSIASRLAKSEYLAYTKYARADATEHDKWTPADPSVVRPSSRPGFRGPVVELMGPLTISAGETFTQALMGRTPHVTRIGENTQGVFSDVLVRKLPNGWVFGLPNEVYRTPEGIAFDGPGISPDVAVPVFAASDVASGKDPEMERALQILRNK
jgi:Peptidase family S41